MAVCCADAPIVQLLADADHLSLLSEKVLRAEVGVDLMTADLKTVLIPTGHGRASSLLAHLATLAGRGVEVRLLHAGVPTRPALAELRRLTDRATGQLPPNLQLRRCPRLHAKVALIDMAGVYLGSANLTGAGLGAKGPTRRNFELGTWHRDAATVERVAAYFNELWEGRHCPGCGRRDICPEPLERPNLAGPAMLTSPPRSTNRLAKRPCGS